MTVELIQGDCLEEMKKLANDGVKVDLVLTDLPYGTTKCKWDNIIPFDEMWEQVYRLIKPNAPIVLFCDEPFSSRLRLSNLKDWKYDWVWIKEGPSNIFNAKYRPLKYHENVAVFYKKQCKFYPDRIMIPRTSPTVAQSKKRNYVCITEAKSTIVGKGVGSKKYISDFSKYDENWKNPSQHIYYSRVKGSSSEKVNHPTQKPVKLLKHFIEAYTDEGDTVLDFTMGSGSTGVACLQTNRNFIGIELDQDYYNIAQERINETKKQTKLM